MWFGKCTRLLHKQKKRNEMKYLYSSVMLNNTGKNSSKKHTTTTKIRLCSVKKKNSTMKQLQNGDNNYANAVRVASCKSWLRIRHLHRRLLLDLSVSCCLSIAKWYFFTKCVLSTNKSLIKISTEVGFRL